MRPALRTEKESKGRTLNAARASSAPQPGLHLRTPRPPLPKPPARLPEVPEAGRAAAGADLLHAQREAQEAAQGGGDPEDLAALQSTGVKKKKRG